MINFFPPMYENELLYSTIARYKKRSGIISKRQLIEDLFGRYISVSSSFFPQYIEDLLDQFPPTTTLNATEIIEQHTMFNLYTGFMPEEQSHFIKEQMKKGSNGKKGNLEKFIGLGGSKVRRTRFLKYCPLCFAEDLKTLGESYWRINHQIVGALYCFKHQVLLKKSTVNVVDSKFNYLCADEIVCDDKVLQDNYTKKMKELNIVYVQNAEYLLGNNRNRKDLSFITSYYIDRLREEGLASNNGNLYMKQFMQLFVEFYTQDYLQIMQSEVDVNSSSNWLRVFVRYNMNKNRIFLRHLLMLQFLNIHPKQLFECKKVVGKIVNKPTHAPKFSIIERREQWVRLMRENPNANRSELRELGKGLCSWIRKHDWDWYDTVTPKFKRKPRSNNKKYWMERDKCYLKLVQEAHKQLLKSNGKPIRITPTTIRNYLGVGGWLRNPRLVRTNEYLRENREELEAFRKRKIKWAIADMRERNLPLTVYKVQLYAGFGGGNKEIKELISQMLRHN